MNRHQRRAAQRGRPGPEQHCHKMIAETAKGIMHEVYNSFMEQNTTYREWKEQNPSLNPKQLEDEYVRTRWGLAIPAARAALLNLAKQTLDPQLRANIVEALELDASLHRGRQPGWLQEAVLPSNGMPHFPIIEALKE